MTETALETPLRWLGGLIDIKVEAEADTAGQWVDLTEYCQRITSRGGQERWGSRFTAASCQLTLDNTAGYFTPATGAVLTDLTWRPGRTIRIRALPDPDNPATSVTLFTGRIQSSNDVYDAGGDVVAVVTLLDALADLHMHNPPMLDTATPSGQSTSERVHSALNRYGFPPSRRDVQGGIHSMQASNLAQSTLEECQRAADAEGGALFADPDNRIVFRQRDWLLGGGPSMGNYETVALVDRPAAFWRFSGSGEWDSSGNGHHLIGLSAVSAVGVTTEDVAIQIPISGAAVTNEGPLEIISDLTIEGWFKPPSGSEGFTLIDCDGAAGQAYLVGYTPTGGGTIYFDASWLPSAINLTPIAGSWNHFAFTVAWTTSTNYTVTRYLNGVQIGQTAAIAVSPPGAGARTVTVAEALGDDWPAWLSELVVYDAVIGPTRIAAHYAAKDLDLNDRSTTVQAEIGFPDGPPIVDAKVSWDIARVRNQIAYARTGGTVQTAEDTTSQTAYGIRTHQRLDYQNNLNTQILTLAERALAAWKDDRVRVDQVTIAARAGDPDAHKLFYDARYGDLVSVRINPRTGFTYDVDTHIIGIAHDITPSDWAVTLILDDSAVAQEA